MTKTSWHKRVPLDMAQEYIGRGWVVHAIVNGIATLIWPKEGAPP